MDFFTRVKALFDNQVPKKMIIWKFSWKNADLYAKLSFPLHLQDMILGFGEKKLKILLRTKIERRI